MEKYKKKLTPPPLPPYGPPSCDELCEIEKNKIEGTPILKLAMVKNLSKKLLEKVPQKVPLKSSPKKFP